MQSLSYMIETVPLNKNVLYLEKKQFESLSVKKTAKQEVFSW